MPKEEREEERIWYLKGHIDDIGDDGEADDDASLLPKRHRIPINIVNNRNTNSLVIQ